MDIKEFWKSMYFRLGLISAITTLSILAVLPRIPLVAHNQIISIDSYIGGYVVNFFSGGLVLDLRDFKKGLDLEGGVRIVLRADMEGINTIDRDAALESATAVISRRVDLLGVSEPYVAPAKVGDDYRIIVELPGVSDVDEAVRLIGQTAQLKFKILNPEKEWSPDNFEEYFLDEAGDSWVETDVTGADLIGADVVFGSEQSAVPGQPQIQLRFTGEGRAKFSELAKANVGKPVALFLDEAAAEKSVPLSMPVISEDLAQGLTNDPVISGNFDAATAKALSINIRAGALPVPVEVLEQKTVGATLGAESIEKSFFAGLVGLILVLGFMVYAYGRLGILASTSLVIYSFIVLAIFKAVPVVLTLPGIAGFILSIGMATDANILIFERIKEERLWGKPNNLAIKTGFERAWNSIRDSNISSLITAAVLFSFGTGPVKGFALTLAIGVLVSMFSAIFVVRNLIMVFSPEETLVDPTKG